MQDDNVENQGVPSPSQSEPPIDDAAPESPAQETEREYPVDRIRRRFERNLGGRPLMVYLVLFAGAAVLLVLLVIVWISATGDKTEQPPPCFDIAVADAQAAIRDGSVDHVEIFLDRERPELGPSVIRLSMTDDSCRELPKGADNVDQAYNIVGFLEVYNSTHDERVRITYRRTNVLPELLMTSTPTPTITPTALPTETPVPTIEATATMFPTETVVPVNTATPSEEASPIASEGTPVS